MNQWASKFGFILAAAGSAVGLGNVWKFPYITGVYGGGAFVLVYLVCVALVGLPILLAEARIGQATNKAPFGAIREAAGDSPGAWFLIAGMGVLAAFTIMSFYSVVAGWCVDFTVRSLMNGWTDETAANAFGQLTGSTNLQMSFHLVFITLVGLVVGRGVNKGIEKASNILMPLLLVLLLSLGGYAMTLDGFGRGVDFLFAADFSKLSASAVVSALGHSFFTLSLGMGAIMTYGSYVPKDDSLVKPGLSIVALDTGLALLAGLVIFPIAFTFGQEAGAGPGLIFKTLPLAFAQTDAGAILGFVFFALLSFAAFTSAISLVEVVVASMVESIGWPRAKATAITCLGIALAGVPVVLSGTFFDAMDKLSSDYLLPLGGMLISLFVGWRMAPSMRDGALKGLPQPAITAWVWTLRVVSPTLVGFVFLNKLIGWIE